MSIQQLFFSGAGDKIVATGGTVYTNGDYKIHVFTTSGTFSVTSINDGATDSGIALADGGNYGQPGGDSIQTCDGSNGGDGGNGGMYRIIASQSFTSIFASTGNYSITIGAENGATSIGAYTSTTNGSLGGAGGAGGTYGNIGSGGNSPAGAGSVSWLGFTTQLGWGGGGGGGGGASAPFFYGYGPGATGGATGGNGGTGGSGGAGGNNGNSSVYAGGEGGGGGGGAGGAGAGCDQDQSGGPGGSGGPGIALIRYKYR